VGFFVFSIFVIFEQPEIMILTTSCGLFNVNLTGGGHFWTPFWVKKGVKMGHFWPFFGHFLTIFFRKPLEKRAFLENRSFSGMTQNGHF
jgi:hypothetical protein